MDIAYIIMASGSLIGTIIVSCGCIHSFRSKLCIIETNTPAIQRSDSVQSTPIDRINTVIQDRNSLTATPIAFMP